MSELKLSVEDMELLEKRLNNLQEQGVEASTVLSGELNMSGCASSSCMAWA